MAIQDPAHAVLAEKSLETKPAEKQGISLQEMRVKVYSQQRVYFDELATSISAVNATGPFDVLPGHHNFISLLDACELEIRRPSGKETQKIKISGGLIHVKADRTTVFLDI